jgi:ribonuclease BN (tRNA processing enzyme)
LQIKIFGARGSYPISNDDIRKYGGHTTCMYIKSDGGAHIIIDAGTGICSLGRELMEQEFKDGKGEASIFFTHTHWDHILGLPFFTPLFIEGNRFNLFTAKLKYSNIQGIFNGLFKPDIFPIPFDDLKSSINLTELEPPSSVKVHDVVVRNMQINHNNITLGYRIDCGSKSVTILSDNAIIELARMGDGFGRAYKKDPVGFVKDYRQRQLEFAKGSDVLICDTHFTAETIIGKEHWGHSTPDEAIRLALECSPKYLLLHHHDPELPDSEVDKKEQYVKEKLKFHSIKVIAPYEGLTINLAGEE